MVTAVAFDDIAEGVAYGKCSENKSLKKPNGQGKAHGREIGAVLIELAK